MLKFSGVGARVRLGIRDSNPGPFQSNPPLSPLLGSIQPKDIRRSSTAVTVQEDEQRELRRFFRVERDGIVDAKRQLAPCRPLEDLRFESGYDIIRDADESGTRKVGSTTEYTEDTEKCGLDGTISRAIVLPSG